MLFDVSNCNLSTVSTSDFCFTVQMLVATKLINMQTTIPVADTYNGNINEFHPAAIMVGDEAPTSKAAQLASPKEPNKSTPYQQHLQRCHQHCQKYKLDCTASPRPILPFPINDNADYFTYQINSNISSLIICSSNTPKHGN